MAAKIITRFVLPLAIVIAGAVGARMLFQLAPSAARSKPEARAMAVEVITVSPKSAPARVTANGVVTAALEVTITAEVSGRIIKRSESLVPGGRFDEGDVLVRLDARDYDLMIRQERGRLKSAELELEQEKGRQAVAKREWEILGKGQKDAYESLVLRRPHLEAAEGNVKAAQSGVARAYLNLDRTIIKAPFNAAVVTENAEVGQVVQPNTVIARLMGTDEAWVRVSVPVDRLEEIEIPGVRMGDDTPTEGSLVRVFQELASGRPMVREGKVLRLDNQLDPETRTAQLIIGVEDPLDPPEGGIPLLPGAYVRVEVDGRTVRDIVALPRTAVHDASYVWAVSRDDKLSRRPVTVTWSGESEIYVRGKLAAGDRVVTSPLALPIEGMPVVVQTATAKVEASPAASAVAE